jgi:hypothetical protein
MIGTNDTGVSIRWHELLILDNDGGVEYIQHDLEKPSYQQLVMIVLKVTEKDVSEGGIVAFPMSRFDRVCDRYVPIRSITDVRHQTESEFSR